jgi:polysaccharide export outer membrane protein
MLVGCVPQKEILYLQDKDNDYTEQTFENKKSQNKIKNFDQIYIQVSSFDNGEVNFMSNDANRYGGGRTEADIAMVSYTVDSDGTVKLPILGKTKVVDLTPNDAAEKIRKELESYLNTPSVRISFVNKSITVLGSVSNPGRYFYSSEYLNVFQAIGLAGDVTEYGNRREVMIIRDSEDNVSRKKIDLTLVDLLAKSDLYLQSDDIVYVAPLKRRHWGFQAFPWSIIISSITAFVLVAEYVK